MLIPLVIITFRYHTIFSFRFLIWLLLGILNLFFIQLVMHPRRGRGITNLSGLASSAEGPALRGDVLERLVETLSMDVFSRPSVV